MGEGNIMAAGQLHFTFRMCDILQLTVEVVFN